MPSRKFWEFVAGTILVAVLISAVATYVDVQVLKVKLEESVAQREQLRVDLKAVQQHLLRDG